MAAASVSGLFLPGAFYVAKSFWGDDMSRKTKPGFDLLGAVYLLIMMAAALVFIAAVLTATVLAADKPNEHFYNGLWCEDNKGKSTGLPTLSTGKIPDCVTSTHAIETDWSSKAWKEGIGQALHYAWELDLQPGLLVIVEYQGDCKNLAISYDTARRNIPRITVWETGPHAYQCGQ